MMKKLMMILIMLILSFVAVAAEKKPMEQKFVNPIFYEQLRGYSEHSHEYLLTPTRMKTINAGTKSCELIKNTETQIILKCTYELDEHSIGVGTRTHYYRFISVGKTKKCPNRCTVLTASSRDLNDLENHYLERYVYDKADCGPALPLSEVNKYFTEEEITSEFNRCGP